MTLTLATLIADQMKRYNKTTPTHYMVGRAGSTHSGRTGSYIHVIWDMEMDFGHHKATMTGAWCMRGKSPNITEWPGKDLADVTCPTCFKRIADWEQMMAEKPVL